ncbi:MAG TPA: L,D-transpeptidase family protein [Anaerolineaceae bacterium]
MAQPSRKSDFYLQQARQALSQGNRRVGRRLVEQALRQDNQNSKAWLLLADLASKRAREIYLAEAQKTQNIRRNSAASRGLTVEKVGYFISSAGIITGFIFLIAAITMVGYLIIRSNKASAYQDIYTQNEKSVFTPTELSLPPTSSPAINPSPSASSPSQTHTTTPVPLPSPTITSSPLPTKTTTPTSTKILLPSPTQTRTSQPEPTDPPKQEQTYTVKRGDTLISIASRYNCSISDLVKSNHLANPSQIKVGQVLIIPIAGIANPEKSAGPSTTLKTNRKSILVDISEQIVFAFEGEQQVMRFRVSTGRNNSTLIGSYKLLDKIENAWSDPWGFWMPYWMGIYYVGSNLENGFHGLPVYSNGRQIWGDQIGTPVSYGCVILPTDEMKQLYQWSDIGTPVEIRR